MDQVNPAPPPPPPPPPRSISCRHHCHRRYHLLLRFVRPHSPRQIMAHKFNGNNRSRSSAATATSSSIRRSNTSPMAAGGSQPEHLHRRALPRSPQILAAATVIFGLLCACICVSGQIDGYIAGDDYPAYDGVPKGLSFKCQGRLPGYYADTETRCQVWHWCLHSGHQYSFICPNGTVFNQAVRVCDWWSNVNCPGSEQLYENNDELYRVAEPSQDDNSV